MVRQGIQIYARVKPTKAKTGQYEVYENDSEGQEPGIAFTVPRDMADGYINNKREVYQFRFNKVFNQVSKQEEIFENVAQGVIDNVLAGYNGTVFAYGQTGSGKTFTITGGAERYSDRGLIPRSLSYIFEYYEQHSDVVHTTHVSYLEIYNESGYDLLDPKHEAAKLEDLPKVTLLEDSDGNIHLKNLSLHPANNEEEALNLLFLGDTNRMIAETPMNQASTRSHCIFTIHISSRETGSATIRRAKLHLVDLAGSERVSKTNVGGTLLTEAKFINLSLHYLEQVIVALSEKSRSHIPYRNSMMTAVLRDSLGGNCMTSMIATCAVEKKNIDESISTCRFAQRVAMIKNDVSLNEEIDPKLMIAQLKKEIQRLKAELAMATGQEYAGELTEEDLERLKLQVKAFIEDTDPETMLNVGADMRKIEYCFQLLKEHVVRNDTKSSPPSRTSVIEGSVDNSYLANQSEVSKLKELIKQRDNEINILVSMLKKEKKRAADADSALKHAGRDTGNSFGLGTRSASQPSSTDELEGIQNNYRQVYRTHAPERASVDTHESRMQPRAEERGRTHPPTAYLKKLEEMSVGRKEAFEIFRRDYAHNEAIEDNKKTLKQRYGEAKTLGEQVNTSRHRINVIKGQLEQHRVRRSMQGFVNGGEHSEEDDPHEQRLKNQIEQEKANYKENFTKLRSMKTEIEHLQHLLEKSKVQMQKDFELWWAEQASHIQPSLPQPPPEQVKAAWRTPPISPIRVTQEKSQPNSVGRRRADNSTAEERLPTSGVSKYASRLRAEAQLASSGVNHFLSSTVNSGTEGLGNGEGKTTRSGKEGQKNTAVYNRRSTGNDSIPMTGDSRTDADIVAFMRARQNLLHQQGRR